MNYQLGIIGVGEFCIHLVNGIMRSHPKLKILLSPRGKMPAEHLSERYGHDIASTNAEVAENAQTILLAPRPAQVEEALNEITFTEDQLVISVAAGVNLETLNNLVSPATAVLCMPTNSAMIGQSPVPAFPANENAMKWMECFGPVVILDNEQQFEACSVLGAYYGWVLALQAESVKWLEDNKVPATQARDLIDHMFKATASIDQHRRDRSTLELSDELRLPGGLTEHGLNMFEANNAIKAWSEVMSSVQSRLSKPY
ncbi:MAG: pyrroline-5-carboxylate reductase [Parasphingorhabdus sp.]|jgi:pyrroline-5-carboxylate reductase